MKEILLSLFVLLLFSYARAQCPQPEILAWTTINDSTFTVTFESSVEGYYNIQCYSEQLSGAYFEGGDELVSGINTATIVLEDIYWPNMTELEFFTVSMSAVCEDNTWSGNFEFYVSAGSMVNDPEFQCSNFISPLTNFMFSSASDTLEIPINISDVTEIESVSLFLDMGVDPYWSDYRMELVHPNGSSVKIQESFLFMHAISVLYSDLGSIPLEPSLDDAIGIYQPFESLTTFNGLQASGEWKIRFIEFGFSGLFNSTILYGVCLNINTSLCTSTIGGHVFIDLDENGIYDSQKPTLANALIENNSNNYTFYSNSQGSYLHCAPSGEGSLSLLNIPEYYEASTLNYSVDSGEYLIGQNIAITPSTSATDLSVDLFTWDANRPGFSATYQVTIDNIGTLCADDAQLSIVFPNYVEIIGSENPLLAFTGNNAGLDMTELCPFESLEFEVEILLDDTVSLGTILEATVAVSPIDGDANPINNTFTSSVIVVGSYDPNDKQVSATTIGDEFLSNGSPLKYTIRFQNTGTFYAERVVIADTIDSDLDLNSLHIISTSHNMQLVREDNVLYFEFDQIFLPDSTTDFDGSIGHVRYEIDPLPSFSEGETIENTAYIYFDFNEPIVTNTMVTDFGNPLSVLNENSFETRLFPNPANQHITISWAQDVQVDRIEIYDLSGRLVKSRNASSENMYLMELNGLADGMYLLNLVADNLQSRQKFMKISER